MMTYYVTILTNILTAILFYTVLKKKNKRNEKQIETLYDRLSIVGPKLATALETIKRLETRLGIPHEKKGY